MNGRLPYGLLHHFINLSSPEQFTIQVPPLSKIGLAIVVKTQCIKLGDRPQVCAFVVFQTFCSILSFHDRFLINLTLMYFIWSYKAIVDSFHLGNFSKSGKAILYGRVDNKHYSIETVELGSS